MSTTTPKPPKRIGRPPKGENARTESVSVKLSPAERRALEAEARAAGLPLAVYLRERR